MVNVNVAINFTWCFQKIILILKYNFVETPRKFILAKLSIRKLGSSSVLINNVTDEDPSLRIESFEMVNLRGGFTKLNFNLISTMQTYKELILILSFVHFILSDFLRLDWQEGLFDCCWSETSPNVIASSSADGSIQLWDLEQKVAI